MASAFAVACDADALVYLTDVAGVKDAEGAVIRWLDVDAIAAMVQQATVSGGMLPKLEACTSALEEGRDSRAYSARGARRSSARILYPPHRLSAPR
jgi:acetylglutamate kinase